MNAGTIRFKKHLLFLANSLEQQVLGLENRAFRAVRRKDVP
jgi:hypothetical protein